MSRDMKPAPEGAIYVCGACGKTARIPYDFKDVSCVVNCVLVKESSIKRDTDGRVKSAEAMDVPTPSTKSLNKE